MDKDAGIITLLSTHTVKETLDKLEEVFRSHGITIYARIDQRAEAAKVDQSLLPLELLIFGNPKAGVPLILDQPLCALDLPLKVLAWEDGDGKVNLSYNSFSYLQKRFSLPDDLIKAISGVEKLIRETIE